MLWYKVILSKSLSSVAEQLKRMLPVVEMLLFEGLTKVTVGGASHKLLSQLPIVVPLQSDCASTQSQLTPELPSCRFEGQ